MNIAIIGSGVYGIGVACALAKTNKNIKIWTESQESLQRLNKSRNKFELLGDIKIPDNITFTTSYEEALKDVKLVFLMTSAKFISSVTKDMKPYINKDMHIIIGSKGIEDETCNFMHQVLIKNIKTKNYGVISGPTFAIDVATGEPSALSCATKNNNTYKIVNKAFDGTNVKTRRSKDLVGTELSGSIKNVIALAAGILEGLGYKESTRAFLITESLHDIKDLIYQLGGSKKTIISYAGVGDLLLTATSEKSRNYTYGMLLAKDKKEAEEFLNTHTVEGYYTLNSIYKLIKKKHVDMPLVNLIYKVVIDGEDPNKLIDFLMKKD